VVVVVVVMVVVVLVVGLVTSFLIFFLQDTVICEFGHGAFILLRLLGRVEWDGLQTVLL
jgi:hypothetical protein